MSGVKFNYNNNTSYSHSRVWLLPICTLSCPVTLVVTSGLTSVWRQLTSGFRSSDEGDEAEGSITHLRFVWFTSNFEKSDEIQWAMLNSLPFPGVRLCSRTDMRQPVKLLSLWCHTRSPWQSFAKSKVRPSSHKWTVSRNPRVGSCMPCSWHVSSSLAFYWYSKKVSGSRLTKRRTHCSYSVIYRYVSRQSSEKNDLSLNTRVIHSVFSADNLINDIL